ncbi:MAG: hypothetical protein OK441_06345, partial [Thaumarchaeota archaeon]|nr:hypothetical protein [Nitrososphaerota archaeon]
MIEDNLKAIYESKSTDVSTKRRHCDYMDRYVNDHLVKKGLREGTRATMAAAVSQFYRRNDSPLFGNFQVSREKADRQPPEPLNPSDIRRVLKVLSVSVRTPLLIEWQSGVEINRVLGFRWGLFEEALSGSGPDRNRQVYYSRMGSFSLSCKRPDR